jgi:hypothetical protein
MLSLSDHGLGRDLGMDSGTVSSGTASASTVGSTNTANRNPTKSPNVEWCQFQGPHRASAIEADG